MWKQLALIVITAAAVAFLGYTIWDRAQKKKTEEELKTTIEQAIASQEIVCDACGKTTTDLAITRKEANQYQVCPRCLEKKGRPVVYYVCTDPDCNRQLIKVKNTIWDDENNTSLPGDPIVCPRCHRDDTFSSDFLSLEDAKKIAEETGQEFP